MRVLLSHGRLEGARADRLEALAAAFLRAGHELRMVGPRQPAAGRKPHRRRLRMPRRWQETLDELAARSDLRRCLRRFRPELIVLLPGGASAAGAAAGNAPVFATLDTPDPGPAASGPTSILVPTAALKSRVAAAVQGKKHAPPSIEVVADGVVLDRYLPAPFQPARANGPLTLGVVGDLDGQDGADALLRAFSVHMAGPARPRPALAISIVGDGPARPELEQLADDLGLAKHVGFTGRADPARVADLLAGFDIVLLPRTAAETVPEAMFACMAAGRPIVAPDAAGTREFLQDGTTGLLFDPSRDRASWEAVLQLAIDPALRDRMGAAARAELLRRDYTWDRHVRRIVELAQASAGGPGGRGGNLPDDA